MLSVLMDKNHEKEAVMKKSFIVLFAMFAGLSYVPLASAGVLYDSLPFNAGCTLQQRIHHGIVTGKLNPRETALLRAEQARIGNYACSMRADGHQTRKERVHLKKELQRFSRHIYRMKHNQHNNYKHLSGPVRYPLCRR